MKDFLARWMPIDASEHGAALDNMNALIHWLMALLFVGWGIYFIYVLFRFRAKKNPQASYTGSKSHFSTWIEGGVILFEAILLIGFAIPAWARWVTPHEPDDNPLVVRVVGQQFAWNIHYSGADGVFGPTDVHLVNEASNPIGLDRSHPTAVDDIVTINQLHLPVDRPVTVLLSTKDVIHSFALPVMRVKQDAIPGQEIPVHFTPTAATPPEGRFPACAAGKECWEIACAQLCGLGHYRMRGFLTVHEPDGFEAWLAAEAPAPAPAPAQSQPAATEESAAEAPSDEHADHDAHTDHSQHRAAG